LESQDTVYIHSSAHRNFEEKWYFDHISKDVATIQYSACCYSAYKSK
jgi:hypothetical protein